jgi:hypothetical protein
VRAVAPDLLRAGDLLVETGIRLTQDAERVSCGVRLTGILPGEPEPKRFCWAVPGLVRIERRDA